MPEIIHLIQTVEGRNQLSVGKRPPWSPADLDELRRLLAQGAALEDADEYGWTAYMLAVRCSLHEVAQILEAAGANTSRRGDAELIAAIFNHDAELARKALLHGASNNAVFRDDTTPLWLATYRGEAEIVSIMVEGGFSVPIDALKPLGEMEITDFMIDPIELEPDYARVAEILIAHGASRDVKTYDGKPLIESFPAKYYPNIHRVLAKNGT